MSFVSRRRALIAAPMTAALVVAGVGVAAAPAWADPPTASDYSELSSAFAAATPVSSTLVLGADISAFTQDLHLPSGAALTLDLSGFDLSLRQLTLDSGSTLAITDSGSVDPGDLVVSSGNFNEGGIRTKSATLVIDGQAHVHATGGGSVAGIGGGNGESGGTVTIKGTSDVTATGGSNAAGIGGGQNGGGGGTTIEGDAVVHATGGNSGAGIGGGSMVGNGATTIRGNADVTATGGSGAAGIGGGNTQGGGTILIEGAATVVATGGPGGGGIGANGTAGVQSVTIQDDADVTAHGGSGATVGIGAAFGPSGQITFADDATVTATAGTTGFGVGMGNASIATGVDILDDAVVTASGGLGSFGSTDDTFGEMTVDGELSIPTGKTLTLPNGSDTISGTGSITGLGLVVNKGSISLPDANVTAAVAKNSNVHNYTVTTVANGGTLTPSTPIRVLAATMNASGRSLPDGARPGFLLTGWKNTATGTAFAENFTVSDDISVTAQWGSYAATLPTPFILGSPVVGQNLVVDPQSSSWADSTTFTYTWLRNGIAISGDDHDDQYTVAGADLGKQISVTAIGTSPSQPAQSKTSAKTAKVTSGDIAGVSAYITGLFAVGTTFSANASSAVPSATFRYQWYVNGVAILNATGATWKATAAAMNGIVSVKVTASATGYKPKTIVALTNTFTNPGELDIIPIPTITGTARAGQKLTAVPGTWSPKPKLSYQWFRDGTPVPGATASTLTLPSDSMGSTWSVRVTGSLTGYRSRFVDSLQTAAVLGNLTGATPKITGTAKVGNVLTAVPGTWTAGTGFDYQWMRISSTGSSSSISGATDPTYTLQTGDKGKTIKVRITGSQSGYGNLSKLSAATSKVG